MRPLSFGDKVFITLVSVYYIFPSLANIISPSSVNERLLGEPAWVGGLFFSIVMCVLFLVIKWLLFGRQKVAENGLKKLPWIFSRRVRWIIMLCFVFVSVRFSLGFSAEFRHLQEYASSGLVPLAYYMFKTYNLVGLLVYCSDRFEQKKDSAYCIVFAACVLATLSGSFDAIIIVACIFAALKGNGGMVALGASFVVRSKVSMLLVPFFVLIVALVTKGGEVTGWFAGGDGFLWAIDTLVSRLSYHAYHFSHFLMNPNDWFDYWVGALEILFDQTIRRFCILFGVEYHTETYQTVNRLNYLTFSPHSDKLSGSSPGVFASLVYIPLGPIGFPFLAFFVAYVLSCFDRIMGGGAYRWPVYLLALIILLSVISSPVDTFNVFSTSFFTLLLLSMSSYRVNIVRSGGINEK